LQSDSLCNITLVLNSLIGTCTTVPVTARPCSPLCQPSIPRTSYTTQTSTCKGRAGGVEEVIPLIALQPLQAPKWKCQNKRSISLSSIVCLAVVFFCSASPAQWEEGEASEEALA